MDESPIQWVIPKRVKGFLVSEANSDLEQARGPNPWKRRTYFAFQILRIIVISRDEWYRINSNGYENDTFLKHNEYEENIS
jgi:hypothetical protein